MNIASLEDDLAQALLIQQLLSTAGHQCTTYTDGKSLLAALQKGESFDLLILDWEIPDITGLEVLRWVRSHMGYAIPALFVPNRTHEDDLVLGLEEIGNASCRERGC